MPWPQEYPGQYILLELETTCTSRIGESLDATMVAIMSAVKTDLLDTLFSGYLGKGGTYYFSSFDIATVVETFHTGFGARRNKSLASVVVDQLGIDVLGAAKYAQTRAIRRPTDDATDMVPPSQLPLLLQLVSVHLPQSPASSDPHRNWPHCARHPGSTHPG